MHLTCDDKYFPNFVSPSSCSPSNGNILKNLSTEATSLECTEASKRLLTITFNLVSASCRSWKDWSSELPVTMCLTLICPADLTILTNWMSPFPILGVSGVLFQFYFILNSCCCLFGFTVAFNNFSVISRWCLVATGSSVLTFIVLPH